MENLTSSTDRLAWSQTREQGMGSGLNIHRDKQPNHKTQRPLIRDYYLSNKYKSVLRID